MKILIINGPNLNLLGFREKEIYGNETYNDLKKYLNSISKSYKVKVKIVQTNYEGKIVDYLHYAFKKHYDGVCLNPGAYTHYSYAIYDAIKSINVPVVEVHLSDINTREDFRKISVIRSACVKSIMGKHFEGYKDGIEYIKKLNK